MLMHEDIRQVNGGIYGRSLYGARPKATRKLPWAPGSRVSNNVAAQLLSLYSVLLAQHRNLWSTHNQISGPTYYGDHLLLERLYTAMTEEIDELAERMVAWVGPGAVDNIPVVEAMVRWLKAWAQEPDPFARAMLGEQAIQAELQRTYDTIKSAGQMSLGMDDMIMGMADEHEKAVYLIQQRLGGRAA